MRNGAHVIFLSEKWFPLKYVSTQWKTQLSSPLPGPTTARLIHAPTLGLWCWAPRPCLCPSSPVSGEHLPQKLCVCTRLRRSGGWFSIWKTFPSCVFIIWVLSPVWRPQTVLPFLPVIDSITVPPRCPCPFTLPYVAKGLPRYDYVKDFDTKRLSRIIRAVPTSSQGSI